MLALDAAPGAEERMDQVEWLPVASLADILTLGLSRPSRAFVVRLRPQSARFSDAYLAFTRDDQLVLGLSLDDEGMLPANQAEAERVMHRLMQDFDGHRGLVGAELPVPLSEVAFARATPTLLTAPETVGAEAFDAAGRIADWLARPAVGARISRSGHFAASARLSCPKLMT